MKILFLKKVVENKVFGVHLQKRKTTTYYMTICYFLL